jgi:hypothetical protein
VSSLKSQWAEILVARRVEEVEGVPLMLEAHHRRRDRDAALALDRHPVRAHPPPRAFTSPANWIAPPNSSNFSVKVVLPASGCEMMASAPAQNLVAKITHQPVSIIPEGAGLCRRAHPRAYRSGWI